MSLYLDYLTHSRHQDFLREAEEARLRRLVRSGRPTRARVRSGLLAR
jgi:hypothetical protein